MWPLIPRIVHGPQLDFFNRYNYDGYNGGGAFETNKHPLFYCCSYSFRDCCQFERLYRGLHCEQRKYESCHHSKNYGNVKEGGFIGSTCWSRRRFFTLLVISADGDNETRIRQHTNAVAAAERAQVGFIAYTSLANASETTMFLAPPHRAAEEAILKTGIPYSFLRNNWYLENEISSIQGVLAGAPWVTSAGTGKVGWAPQQDYAEAVAAVLAGNGHEKTIYELSGKLLTQEELVSALGAVLGREVLVQQVDDAAYADIMKGAGVPEFIIPFLVDIQKGIRDGALEIESSDFEKLLGRPTTPIDKALSQIVNGMSQAK